MDFFKYVGEAAAGKEFDKVYLQNNYGIDEKTFNDITDAIKQTEQSAGGLVSAYRALMLAQDFGVSRVKTVLTVTNDYLKRKYGKEPITFASAQDKFNAQRANEDAQPKKEYGTVDAVNENSNIDYEETPQDEAARQAQEEQERMQQEEYEEMTKDAEAQFMQTGGGKMRIPPVGSAERAEYEELSAQAKKDFFTSRPTAISVDQAAQNFADIGRDVDIFEEIRRMESKRFKRGKYKNKTRMSVDEGTSAGQMGQAQEVKGWSKEFPKVKQLSSNSVINDADFKAAKNMNEEAATRLIDKILSKKIDEIIELAKLYPDAILIPVNTEEKYGYNHIPITIANFINKIAGLKINEDVKQTNSPQRTGKGHWHRLAFRAQFKGKVEAGKKYILIDDVVSDGGTLSDLKQHIEQQGGEVVLVTSLATARPHGKTSAQQIGLTEKTLLDLEKTFNVELLSKLLKKYGVYNGHYKALTEREARTIIEAGDLAGVERGFIDAIVQRSIGTLEKAGRIPSTRSGNEEARAIIERIVKDFGGDYTVLTKPQGQQFLKYSSLEQVENALKNKQTELFKFSTDNTQIPQDSGKGRLYFPDAVSSFVSAEHKKALEEALKKLSRQLFGDEKVFTYDKFVDGRGRVIGGFNYKDVIGVAAKESKSQTEWKFYHEAMHKAVNLFLTAEERQSLLDAFVEHNGGLDALESKIKAKRKNYNKEDFDVVIEELIADAFADYARGYGGFSAKLKLLFEKLLNRIKAFVANTDKVDSFFNDVLSGKLKGLQGKNDGASFKYLTAYHGSGVKNIKEFSNDFIGSGEGSQAFGWGHYFTSLRDVAEFYRATITASNINANDGQVYKVELPESEDFLQWDKPMSQQNENVQQAVENIINDIDPIWKKVKEVDRKLDPDKVKDMTGKEIYRIFEELFRNAKAASQQLLRYGVKGNEYPAGTLSAMEGQGRNFVLFDPKLAHITETFYSVNAAAFGLTLDEVKKQYQDVERKYKGTDKWLKAPNGQSSNLDERQWVMTRTTAFKKWFGDWELAEKWNKFINEATQEITPHKSLSKKEAEDIFKNSRNVEHNELGKTVLPVETVNKILQHKGFDTSTIIKLLPELFKNSSLLNSQTEKDFDSAHKKRPNIAFWHNTFNKFTIGKDTYIIRFTVTEEYAGRKQKKGTKGIQTLHSTFVSEVSIEKMKNGSESNTSNSLGETEPSDKILQQLLHNVKKNVDNTSKIVDKNGEPMIVYHGTTSNFEVFDKRKSKRGFYFATRQRKEMLADYYSQNENSRAFYLNLKKALITTPDKNNLQYAKENGYDGIIVKSNRNFIDEFYNYSTNQVETRQLNKGDIVEIIAFEPNQIKSVDNQGTFDGDNSNVYYQGGNNEYLNTPSKDWDEGFPNTTQLTTTANLKKNKELYEKAKSGDVKAAGELVYSIMQGKAQEEKVNELAKKYPNAVVAAVEAQEAKGHNQIPKALAQNISEKTGLELNDDIVQSNVVGNTGKGDFERLAYRPKFDGKV
ncbi:MAG: hypothetical protein LBU09_01200, partial [Endomicrobium sp.]|nr:hypothetical protein [Endomicrobium sp.]